ncbi:cob(I)yrinic acid a,c-diamide adenosyltransferase [Candidatus Shapirobacteria bacterium]|nr:cob(I)yrinic acid a,c-diamide adenosyltransferase [Candidatus Shapirobacteria bacterium]
MSITTKTGDDGKSRWSGKVVVKDSPLLEAVGTLDELQASLGVLSAKSTVLSKIQKDLYEIMGVIAYGSIFNLQTSIFNLEKETQELEKNLGPITGFLIFKNKEAREINWVRTVCRRCERRLVTLSQSQQIDPNILIYINRLSDYLFMMARLREEATAR